MNSCRKKVSDVLDNVRGAVTLVTRTTLGYIVVYNLDIWTLSEFSALLGYLRSGILFIMDKERWRIVNLTRVTIVCCINSCVYCYKRCVSENPQLWV